MSRALLVAILLVGAPAEPRDIKREFESRYGEIARAIMAKDVAALEAASYRHNDIKPEEVGKDWARNFESVRAYGSVAFDVASVESRDEEALVEVRRRAFFTPKGQDGEEFEEGRSRDRWRNVNGAWRMVGREQLSDTLTGAVHRERVPDSPRLVRLRKELDGNKAAAQDAFWRDCAGKAPLTEPLADDAGHLLVTFLWRGDASVERIEVRGGPYASSRAPFDRIADTDVWYHSERLPKDARYVYALIVTREIERRDASGKSQRVRVETHPVDPLNPRVFNAGSVLELPEAPKDVWHDRPTGAAKGRLERFQVRSAALKESRGVAVYTPAGFDPARPHALAVFLDGEECERLMDVPSVLDNLIAAKEIPPTVAILVDAGQTRGRDLVFSDAFVAFLADELTPWASKSFKLTVSSKTTLVSGMSLGGLTAAYAAQQRPHVFGNVLSQSGAFWRPRPGKLSPPEGWLPGEIAKSKSTPIRYYLEVGRFEATSMVENNRRTRDVLVAKGNHVTYDEYHGGHDHVNWRVSVGKGIVVLLAKAKD